MSIKVFFLKEIASFLWILTTCERDCLLAHGYQIGFASEAAESLHNFLIQLGMFSNQLEFLHCKNLKSMTCGKVS